MDLNFLIIIIVLTHNYVEYSHIELSALMYFCLVYFSSHSWSVGDSLLFLLFFITTSVPLFIKLPLCGQIGDNLNTQKV